MGKDQPSTSGLWSGIYSPPESLVQWLFHLMLTYMKAQKTSSGPLSNCRDVEGVIRRANATEFGLASGVFTRDIHKVCRLFLHASLATAVH